MMRCSSTMTTLSSLLLLLLCFAPSTANNKLRVRGLVQTEGRSLNYEGPRTGKYQNPCTGSWSNDVEVLNIDDCEGYGSDGGVVGGSGGSGGDRDTDDLNLDCNINTKDDPTSAEKTYPVEYWYGVKTTSNDTSWLPILEDKIYDVAIGRLENCIGYLPRRQLLGERRLGILGITPAPEDEIRDDVRLPVAYADPDQECFVVEGSLQIIARENDDLEKTIQSMQDAIQDSMTNDELLGEDIPNVTQVIYLGTSKEDVENQYILPPVVSPGVIRTVNTNEDDDDDDSAVPIIIAASATGFVALLLLLFWRQKRAVVTRNASAFPVLDDNGRFVPLVGTGDPPGSFHHGVYHYMRDGQGYLSTNCYDCHETRLLSNSDYGGVLPPVAICSSEEDDYNNLILANSKDLGGKTSGMDVHSCASSTCKLCRPFTKDVAIVPIEKSDLMESQIVNNEELASINE